MIIASRFTDTGLEKFRSSIDSLYEKPGIDMGWLISDPTLSNAIEGVFLDDGRKFTSRYEFGKYLCEALTSINRDLLLSPENDNLWAWINALYFQQLALKEVRKSEHYLCTRKGSIGSKLHRNAARTAYEIVSIHGELGSFALQQPMQTHGQLLESLSASQTVVRNRSFFSAASKIYVNANGKLKRGYSSKPKKPKDRKPGDLKGKGSVRRLPGVLKRLDLTYDIESLSGDQLVEMLPSEYAHWTKTP